MSRSAFHDPNTGYTFTWYYEDDGSPNPDLKYDTLTHVFVTDADGHSLQFSGKDWDNFTDAWMAWLGWKSKEAKWRRRKAKRLDNKSICVKCGVFVPKGSEANHANWHERNWS